MNDIVDRLIPLLWTQTWQVAAVVAAITLVTRVKPIRRRPHLAYALWLLVLAKCLTPPLIPSPTSPFSWALASAAAPIMESTPTPTTETSPPQVATNFDTAPHLVPQSAERPLVESGARLIETSSRGELPAAESALPLSTDSADTVSTLPTDLFLAWLIGGTLCFTLSLCRYLRTRRRLIRSGHADTTLLDELISEISRSLRLRRSPRAILTPLPFGPAVLGLLRPVLVVPESATVALSPERLRLVLAHELVHLRRGDHWMGLMQFLVQAIWWFNPLVWWANREINRIREQCCDEEVLANLRCEPARYAQTLLDVVRLGARSRPLVLTAGVSAMHVTGQRLQHIMSDASRFHRATPRLYWAVAALATLFLLPGAGLALQDESQPAAAKEAVAQQDKKRGAEKAADQVETNEEPEQEFYDHPITVVGKALDPDGKPIAGATIYLVSTNVSKNKLLGQTTTDAEGRYEFRDKPLPIRVPANKDFFEEGSFQVFGKAPGRAFAWQGMKHLVLDKRGRSNTTTYLAGQRIELDLAFSNASYISGRVNDERRNGVAGATIRLANCDYLNHAGREPHKNYREFWAMSQASEVMPEELRATTDDMGRFRFSSVPPEVICWLLVEHPKYADMSLYSSTADDPPNVHDEDHPVRKRLLLITLKEIRTIPVRVISAASGLPLDGIKISGYQKRATGTSDYGTSDKEGNLTLRLPPGEYKLLGDPARGENNEGIVRTYQELIVAESQVEQPVTLKMDQGCLLVLKAIDADTGKGIPGVNFWYDGDKPQGSRWSVQSSTSYVDNPKTNDQGELRAVVLPGKRVYGVGFGPPPNGYRAVDSDRRGRELDLPAGETVVAEFKLQRPSPNPPDDTKANATDDRPSETAPKGASNEKASGKAKAETVDDSTAAGLKHYPITVSGRAFDRNRTPINDATIYLVAFHVGSTEYKPPTVIAQTTTGPDGRYLLRRAQLPVTVPEDKNRRESGSFQVLGKAPGHAFAWQGPYSYRTDPRDADVEPRISNRESLRKFTPESLKRPFVLNQSIEIDLTFGPAKTINGRFVDEEGKPVEGVQVRIKSCDFVDTAGRDRIAREFTHIDTAGLAAMPDQVQATSDSDGRFSFDSIPPGVMCYLNVTHPLRGNLFLYSSTAPDAPSEHYGEPLAKAPVELILRNPKTVAVHLHAPEQSQPLGKTFVRVIEKPRIGRIATSAYTDENGKVSLKLPQGEYTLFAHPGLATGHIETTRDLTVTAEPVGQSLDLRVTQGCRVILKAIDAETGDGIPEVAFWHAPIGKPNERTPLHTDRSDPQTERNGELLAVVSPGTRLYGIANWPPQYAPSNEDIFKGRELELPAGKAVTAEFKFQKRVFKANPRGVKGPKENPPEKAKKQVTKTKAVEAAKPLAITP